MDQPTAFILFLLTFNLFLSGTISTTFTILNRCDYTVWPGILSNAGVPPLSSTGFALQTGQSKTVTPPASWGGRFWGRTLCSQDSSGKFSCFTGDCGSAKIECVGNGAAPPATLAEFTLNGHGGMDFFDVSLVDGYNVPMLVVPRGGSGPNCSKTGCVMDLNRWCPPELRVTSLENKQGLACKSACDAFGSPEYCCSGAYNNPSTCKPSSYSQIFKKACPSAYSYAYDDSTSTFTCAHANYLITFCPSPSASQKASEEEEGQNRNAAKDTPSTMVYEGALESDQSSASRIARTHELGPAGIVSNALAVWWSRHLFFFS